MEDEAKAKLATLEESCERNGIREHVQTRILLTTLDEVCAEVSELSERLLALNVSDREVWTRFARIDSGTRGVRFVLNRSFSELDDPFAEEETQCA